MKFLVEYERKIPIEITGIVVRVTKKSCLEFLLRIHISPEISLVNSIKFILPCTDHFRKCLREVTKCRSPKLIARFRERFANSHRIAEKRSVITRGVLTSVVNASSVMKITCRLLDLC